jgi:DNA-directed RNA polymerase specialized sigma24 family protein
MAQHDPTKGRSFSSWVCLALDCRVKNVFREYARQGASALFDERGASTTQFDRLEAKLTIQKLTAMLSPADQKFIKMKLEGHTDKEIGLEFGLNLNAVWKHFIKLKADMKAKA